MVFGYSIPGFFKEYEIEAASLEEAKKKIRSELHVSRLPSGIRVWDASERPIVRWHPVPIFGGAWVV